MERVKLWILIIFLVVSFIFITGEFGYKVSIGHSKDVQNLQLVAKESPGPGLNVYIYKYHDGYGGYYHFVVAERNYKDGVSVTQLK
jgi:hypothetical protein